jgi:tRNA(fMet)-specific endonuclease VapC
MKKPPTTAATSAAENRWMLDTNIISHAIRNPHGSLALRLQRMDLADPQSLCTSLVVQCELIFGATKAGAEQLARKIATMLKFIRPMPMDASLIAHYATIRTHLERQGTPIGPNDTLIAAHALALDCTLVTDNDTEFNRVPGLRVENWLREATAPPSL